LKRLITICAAAVLAVFANSGTYASPWDDNFDDNSMNTSLWSYYQQDSSSEFLLEQNGRLELLSNTVNSYSYGALYYANGWSLSTAADFALKADFHNSYDGTDWVEVMIGLQGGDFNLDPSNFSVLGIQAVTDTEGEEHISGAMFSGFCYTNGEETIDQRLIRVASDGTLFISYNSAEDDLYLSYTGYGEINADYTIEDVLVNSWNCDYVTPFIGGDTEIELISGIAYLDNFVVDSGTIYNVNVVPVPGAVLLGSMGISLAGWLLRKRRQYRNSTL
jgi:hypothetical protein